MTQQNPNHSIQNQRSRSRELPGGIFHQRISGWQRVFITVILVGSFLLSPLSLIPAYALAAPTLIAPDDSATITPVEAPPLGIPEFKWAAVTGATSYRLQISNDIGFVSTIVNITTPNTTYTPINVNNFPDGTWYWRVRVEAPAPIGDYSSIRSFTKQWATPDNKPSLSFPAAAATLDFYDQPIFSWSPVIGAAEYKLQIYLSSGGWSNLSYSALTLTTTHQPNTKLVNGTYYWRVVPLDPGGREGTPSDESSFTSGYNLIPTPLEPENNANPAFTPVFRWTAVRGAQFYRLQYSTDPSFNTGVTQIDTRSISYTPTSTLPNDVNYYWRVRVHSGASISDWSPSLTFIKKWYIKPVLLTPTNNYQHQRFPIYSWTPVPGASYYFVEISKVPGFSPIYTSGNTANTFYTPTKYDGATSTYYWRVTPYDGNGKAGVPSNTSSYVSYSGSVAPQQVSPLFYYPPNTFSGFSGITMNPFEDRTAALPVFTWNRVYVPIGDPNQGKIYAEAYRVQVSTDPTFVIVNWTVDTQNLVASPTTANPFTPLSDTDYYWRVRPLIGGVAVGQWSQIWKARFDLSQGLTPSIGSSPTLLRPTSGFEFAETTPLLEWFPLDGATTYDVEISRDSDFSSTVNSATVDYPSYAPVVSLAQRSLGAVDYGVYYWRVRATGGSWSETRRFQIAAQSQWQDTRVLGDVANQLQIASDPVGDVADLDFDLKDLQVAQSSNYWYFGFHVPTTPSKNLTYALYLDLDHQDGTGATFDALSSTATTISTYRPEYAIYVLQEAGAYSASKVQLYHWNGISWDTVNILDSIGGNLSQVGDYIELQVPNTAIGYQDTTGSYAATLFSLNADGSGDPQDSVPADPNVPGTGPISRFANVTERMNLSMPLNNAGADPTAYPSILPFFWDWPVLSPWSGAIMKAYLDPLYTTEAATYTLTSDTAYYAQTTHAWEDDFMGDNTYYWRIQPRYRVGGTLYNGAWSQGWRFERKGFLPQSLTTSVSFATPTFSWDIVEGAESYDLQVDDDPNFGTTAININTKQNSYTHTSTLNNATYYWRVRVRRYGGLINNWTSNQVFTLALPKPDGLTHLPAGEVNRAPTLCWNPLILNAPGGDPVLAAWKYRIQVSKEFTFSSIFDTIDTEQSCWTPVKGYDEGQYYWRAAMFDGNGKLGDYSDYQTFTKQYPVSTLLSPTNGSSVARTPTFIWTPVNGAAKYKIEVSLVANFATTIDSVTTNSTRYTPTKAYSGTGTYYWRVAIIDADGKTGPFNNASLIIDPTFPGLFTKVSPNNGATNLTANPVLSWGASSGATSYQYCYGTVNPCTNWTSNGLNTSLTLSGVSPSTTYYWNVRAINTTGTTYSDNSSANWWFSTAAIGIPVLTSLNPAVVLAGSPDFLLTITGTGFWPGNVIYWNGAAKPTNFISSTQLSTSISAADVTAVSAVEVSVKNPALDESNKLILNVHTFADATPNLWFWKWVEGFYAKNITTGCALNPLRYCPDRAVTRAEMAVFILRAQNVDVPGYVPIPDETPIFDDVPVVTKEWMQPWIEEFYEQGITTGCAVSPKRLYCPERQVTRAEMAVFMLRAKYGATYTPPPATGEIFDDIPVVSKEWMAPWIEQFYREGITTGCAVGLYCPEQSVTRAEMAVFLDRAFGFPQVP